MAEPGDEIEPRGESFMDKVTEKIQHDDSSSSDSDSGKKKKHDDELKKKHHDAPPPSSSSMKSKIYRLFGREKPVHKVFGGGKPADVFLWRNKNIVTRYANVNNGDYQLKESSENFEGQNDKISPSKQEIPDQETDISSGFLKKASYMLGNISAPPAFASEFPTKYMASNSGPSSSVNVTTSGMIHISNVSFNGGAVDLSLGKHTQVNIVFSFGLGQREGNSVNSRQVGKVVNSGVSRSWFYAAFLWLLVLSLSFKIGSLVCSMS